MRSLLASTAILLLACAGTAAAQDRDATPEQRVERLERQVRQLQSRIFPRGQPVDTAGFANDPAASQVVVRALSSRLDNLDRTLAEITRTNEANAQRLGTLEAEIARLRTDSEQRIRAIESARPAAASSGDDRSASTQTPPRPATAASAPARTGDLNADAEAAYDVGYQLWQQKKYDEAVAALRAMTSSFPNHRRVSWANNLAGRALLDKGEYRAAAEALLANYRGNPRGERAADSLYYLGQSLVGLKQSAQACKAYAELEQVYGSSLRADLKAMIPPAKAKAGCR